MRIAYLSAGLLMGFLFASFMSVDKAHSSKGLRGISPGDTIFIGGVEMEVVQFKRLTTPNHMGVLLEYK